MVDKINHLVIQEFSTAGKKYLEKLDLLPSKDGKITKDGRIMGEEVQFYFKKGKVAELVDILYNYEASKSKDTEKKKLYHFIINNIPIDKIKWANDLNNELQNKIKSGKNNKNYLKLQARLMECGLKHKLHLFSLSKNVRKAKSEKGLSSDKLKKLEATFKEVSKLIKNKKYSAALDKIFNTDVKLLFKLIDKLFQKDKESFYKLFNDSSLRKKIAAYTDPNTVSRNINGVEYTLSRRYDKQRRLVFLLNDKILNPDSPKELKIAGQLVPNLPLDKYRAIVPYVRLLTAKLILTSAEKISGTDKPNETEIIVGNKVIGLPYAPVVVWSILLDKTTAQILNFPKKDYVGKITSLYLAGAEELNSSPKFLEILIKSSLFLDFAENMLVQENTREAAATLINKLVENKSTLNILVLKALNSFILLNEIFENDGLADTKKKVLNVFKQICKKRESQLALIKNAIKSPILFKVLLENEKFVSTKKILIKYFYRCTLLERIGHIAYLRSAKKANLEKELRDSVKNKSVKFKENFVENNLISDTQNRIAWELKQIRKLEMMLKNKNPVEQKGFITKNISLIPRLPENVELVMRIDRLFKEKKVGKAFKLMCNKLISTFEVQKKEKEKMLAFLKVTDKKMLWRGFYIDIYADEAFERANVWITAIKLYKNNIGSLLQMLAPIYSSFLIDNREKILNVLVEQYGKKEMIKFADRLNSIYLPLLYYIDKNQKNLYGKIIKIGNNRVVHVKEKSGQIKIGKRTGSAVQIGTGTYARTYFVEENQLSRELRIMGEKGKLE